MCPTCIPAWLLWCCAPTTLQGASATVYRGSRVSLSLCVSFPIFSLVILFIKHQLHAGNWLLKDTGRLSGWQQHRLLEKNEYVSKGLMTGWQDTYLKRKKVNMFLYFLECRRANLIFSSSHPAHQDQRGKLSGGQTDSISSVDPQQVIGSYIQVMVTMGGGKHTHLFTEVRNWFVTTV